MGDGLFATLGDRHKAQRKMLNPLLLNANHMRSILPVFYQVTYKVCDSLVSLKYHDLTLLQVRDILKERVKEQPQDIDILHWLSRTALEIIAQAGLGTSLDPFTEDASSELVEAIKNFQSVGVLFIIRRTSC